MPRLVALSAISTAVTLSSPSARKRATAPDKAETLDAPAMTATPAARAAGSSAVIEATRDRADLVVPDAVLETIGHPPAA